MTQTHQHDEINALGGLVASKPAQFSWAMFDWANQPYFTVVTTVIFAPYFVQTFVGDPVRGQEMYSFSIGLAGLLVALLAPIFGAISDVSGRRKPWIKWARWPNIFDHLYIGEQQWAG